MFNNTKIDDEKIEKILDKIGLFYKVIHEKHFICYLFRDDEIPYELWINEYGCCFFGIVKRQFDKPKEKYLILKTSNLNDIKQMLKLLFKD